MGKRGFSLIELLVVVGIIGILAAIAIPQYNQYKIQAVDAKTKSDLHNAAVAMEAYYGSNSNTYAGASAASLTNFGFRQSPGVTLTVTTADQTGYTLDANATGGSGTWEFKSGTGTTTLTAAGP